MGSRPFASNQQIDFKDYLNNKKSIEIIKGTKSQNSNLNYFLSYNDFIQLAKSFFKYSSSNSNSEKIQEPLGLFDKTISSRVYNQITDHIQTCSFCINCQTMNNLPNCPYVKSTLYSIYNNENGVNKKQNAFYFPNKIDVSDWCYKQCTSNNPPSNYSSYKPLKEKAESQDHPIPYFVNIDTVSLQDPILIIAFLSNNKEENTNLKQYSISFKTIYLDYEYLKKLMFDSISNDFHISYSNRLNNVLTFGNQLCNDKIFVLSDQLLKAYEELNEVSRNSLKKETMLRLDKETSSITSILDVNSKQISLNWDLDIIPHLITNKIIIPSNKNTSSASVLFSINVLYYCKCLQLNLSMNFYFQTDIPGYENTSKWNKISFKQELTTTTTSRSKSRINNIKNNLCGNYNLCK